MTSNINNSLQNTKEFFFQSNKNKRLRLSSEGKKQKKERKNQKLNGFVKQSLSYKTKESVYNWKP